MDNYRFGSAYKDLPEKKLPSNPERREILEAPRKWMRFFNATMQDYLIGESTPDRDTFLTQLDDYYRWNDRCLEPLMTRAREIDDPTAKNDIANEFIFHQINGPLTFMWDQLLYDNVYRYDNKALTDIQTHLAVSMTPSMQRLIKLNKSKVTTDDYKEYKLLKGTMSEVDSMLTLLEVVKKDSRLVVLPAPELFESNHSASNRNADILFIDPMHKLVHGIQVKTNTVEGTGGRRHYDTDYVTVIDSAYELGNTVYTTSQADRRTSLPGQLAMELLSERPLKGTPPAIKASEFMRTRQIAKELTRGRRSFLGQATIHLAERIIPELERNHIDKIKIMKNNVSDTQDQSDQIA